MHLLHAFVLYIWVISIAIHLFFQPSACCLHRVASSLSGDLMSATESVAAKCPGKIPKISQQKMSEITKTVWRKIELQSFIGYCLKQVQTWKVADISENSRVACTA